MTTELIPIPTTPTTEIAFRSCPSIITDQGERATKVFAEFFLANIRNENTRRTYSSVVKDFFEWCEVRGMTLQTIEPIAVAAYIEWISATHSKPSVKLHLSAIRGLFDHLVVNQIIPFNPAAPVRGPRYSIKIGKTPVLDAEQTRLLLDSIDTSNLVGLRDRAIIGTMFFTFARVGAVVKLKVSDLVCTGRRFWLQLDEKRGRQNRVPIHHALESMVIEYMEAAEIIEDKNGFLFRAATGKTRKLTTKPILKTHVLRMIKRRARQAGLPGTISCHTFRASGITQYLGNSGSLEVAQSIAGHESPRTTKIYDHSQDRVTISEIERILI